MIYDHIVKMNGIVYNAGEEVPEVDNGAAAEVVAPIAAEEEKPRRTRKKVEKAE